MLPNNISFRLLELVPTGLIRLQYRFVDVAEASKLFDYHVFPYFR